MRSTIVLTWKELRQIFLSPIAYVFLVVFVVFVTAMFFRSFFLIGQVNMSSFFDWFPWAFAFVIPGITMRMWAEERRQGTIEFLLTAPVETWNIVVAKFLAGLALVTLCAIVTLLVPYTVSQFGDLDPGPVWGSYLGSLLLGSTCIAIGMFFSSFTQDQVVAFLVSLIVLLASIMAGMSFIQSLFEAGNSVGSLLRVISPTTHFESMGRGVVDLRDVYSFAAMSALFLYLNVRVIDLRRWK